MKVNPKKPSGSFAILGQQLTNLGQRIDQKITILDKKVTGLDQCITNLNQKVNKKITALDQKIEQRERSLLAEIRITANETKEDMRQEFRTRIDKLYNHMDAFIKEIRDSRDERAVIGHRLEDYENRISKLESSVFA